MNCYRVEVWGPKGKEANLSQPRKPSWPLRVWAPESPSLQDHPGPEQLCPCHQIRPLGVRRGEFGLGAGGRAVLSFAHCFPLLSRGLGELCGWGWCHLEPCHSPHPWSHWPELHGRHQSGSCPWLYLIQQALTHHVARSKNNTPGGLQGHQAQLARGPCRPRNPLSCLPSWLPTSASHCWPGLSTSSAYWGPSCCPSLAALLHS